MLCVSPQYQSESIILVQIKSAVLEAKVYHGKICKVISVLSRISHGYAMQLPLLLYHTSLCF